MKTHVPFPNHEGHLGLGSSECRHATLATALACDVCMNRQTLPSNSGYTMRQAADRQTMCSSEIVASAPLGQLRGRIVLSHVDPHPNQRDARSVLRQNAKLPNLYTVSSADTPMQPEHRVMNPADLRLLKVLA